MKRRSRECAACPINLTRTCAPAAGHFKHKRARDIPRNGRWKGPVRQAIAAPERTAAPEGVSAMAPQTRFPKTRVVPDAARHFDADHAFVADCKGAAPTSGSKPRRPRGCGRILHERRKILSIHGERLGDMLRA